MFTALRFVIGSSNKRITYLLSIFATNFDDYFLLNASFQIKEHSKTKNDVVGKLQTELSDLKKELHHRKKIIAVQQQLIHSGNESYVKVVNVRFFADFCKFLIFSFRHWQLG